MVERRIIVDGISISYHGLFEIEELYKLIDHFLRERAYTKHELSVEEHVYKDGKKISITKEPYKKISDYAKYVLRIEIEGEGINDKVAVIDGKKRTVQEGSITVTFYGFLTTDYEGRWDKRPLFYFLRALFDQYVFKIHTERYEAGLVEEVNLLYGMVKGFFNLYR